MTPPHLTPSECRDAVAGATRTCLAIAEAANVHDTPISLLAAMAVLISLCRSAGSELAKVVQSSIGIPGIPAKVVKRHLDALEGIARMTEDLDAAGDTLKDVARKLGAFDMVADVLGQIPQRQQTAEAKRKAAG